MPTIQTPPPTRILKHNPDCYVTPPYSRSENPCEACAAGVSLYHPLAMVVEAVDPETLDSVRRAEARMAQEPVSTSTHRLELDVRLRPGGLYAASVRGSVPGNPALSLETYRGYYTASEAARVILDEALLNAGNRYIRAPGCPASLPDH